MNWKELIPEIISLKKDFIKSRSVTKKNYTNYKKGINRFYFLDIIMQPKKGGRQEDNQLEIAVKDLFNSIGIKSKIPPTKDDFDVISKFKEVNFYIEVKNGNMPSENDMLQALKYGRRQRIERGIVVIWNNNTTDQEFDENRKIDALLNSYSILTTKELFKGYLKLKTNRITFEKFLSQLKKIGEIRFSSKALRESL